MEVIFTNSGFKTRNGNISKVSFTTETHTNTDTNNSTKKETDKRSENEKGKGLKKGGAFLNEVQTQGLKGPCHFKRNEGSELKGGKELRSFETEDLKTFFSHDYSSKYELGLILKDLHCLISSKNIKNEIDPIINDKHKKSEEEKRISQIELEYYDIISHYLDLYQLYNFERKTNNVLLFSNLITFSIENEFLFIIKGLLNFVTKNNIFYERKLIYRNIYGYFNKLINSYLRCSVDYNIRLYEEIIIDIFEIRHLVSNLKKETFVKIINNLKENATNINKIKFLKNLVITISNDLDFNSKLDIKEDPQLWKTDINYPLNNFPMTYDNDPANQKNKIGNYKKLGLTEYEYNRIRMGMSDARKKMEKSKISERDEFIKEKYGNNEFNFQKYNVTYDGSNSDLKGILTETERMKRKEEKRLKVKQKEVERFEAKRNNKYQKNKPNETYEIFMRWKKKKDEKRFTEQSKVEDKEEKNKIENLSEVECENNEFSTPSDSELSEAECENNELSEAECENNKLQYKAKCEKTEDELYYDRLLMEL
jgi:hypothetical protein